MKKIQFLLLIVASVLTAANPTDNDVTPFKFVNDTITDKEVSKTIKECLPFSRPADCEEIRQNGNTTNGVYTIWPRSRKTGYKSIEVYCDMTTAGGGWTVLQRRGKYGNAENYFNKTWEFYKSGFGELEKEFWLGNDVIHALTNQESYSVRFDMRLVNETSAYAQYDQFWIQDEKEYYQLRIIGFSGNAGDSMSVGHHNMKFSTWDRDNDRSSPVNCASNTTGGWWFDGYNGKSCHQANLNGMNWKGKYVNPHYNGIIWKSFSGYDNSLEFTEIKIKSIHFR